jgi:poly(A) polymerase
MVEREFALEVVRRLRDAGFAALWAGGCVRDQLLGLEPHDYDVATDARPEQVRPLFRRTVEVGASFGVVEVIGPRYNGDHIKVQVATFRTEGPYSDGRRPDHVEFASPEADAQRRDFTVNGIFFDPLTGQVLDYVNGQADLRAGILRAIGDPRARFAEDKLRMLRAVRIAARFAFTIEEHTRAAIVEMAPQIGVVSAERITDEFRKMLVHERRSTAMNLLWDLGLLHAILPELVSMKGLPQGAPGEPAGDLWDHVMQVLDRLVEPSFTLALAALLHDVGKPRVVGRTPDRYTFHSHEHVGSRIAHDIALRFKLSNAERERIEWLVEKHQYLAEAPRLRPSRLQPVLLHPGIGELLALHRADAQASGRDDSHVVYCERLLSSTPRERLDPPPLLTGDDLLAAGLAPGPRFKELLDAARAAQLDGALADRAAALEWLKQQLASAATA